MFNHLGKKIVSLMLFVLLAAQSASAAEANSPTKDNNLTDTQVHAVMGIITNFILSSSSAVELESTPTLEIGSDSVTIKFIANQNAQGQIEYGTSTDYGSETTKEFSFNYSSHTQTLTNLEAGTTYHYRVHFWNEDGVETISEDYSFVALSETERNKLTELVAFASSIENIPDQYKNDPRWFLLDVDTNPPRPWANYAAIPVWAFALVKGEAPNREWLVYVQSHGGDVSGVTVSIPDYGDVTVDGSETGSFYSLKEKSTPKTISTNITTIQNTDNNHTVAFSTEGAINILNYGAIGDGITDNTGAFQQAFLNETKIYIPNGIFLINTRILIDASVELIYGEGTIIGEDKTGILSTKGSEKLIIDGLTFIFKPTQDTIYGSIYFNDTSFKNIAIQNCRFIGQNNWGNAILLAGKQGQQVDNIKITNNKFIDITRAAIEILQRGDDPLNPNIITNIEIRDNNFTYNLESQNTEFNPAISLSAAVNGTIIDNNNINGYYWGIELDGSVNQKITNNRVVVVDRMMSIDHGSDPTGNTIIENNYFSSPYRFWIHTAKNIVIRNNTIDGLIYIWKSDNITISNNKCYSKLFTTIWINNSINSNVEDNYVENIGGYDGIRGFNKLSNSSNIVKNNKIYVEDGDSVTRNVDGSNISFINNISLSMPITLE